MGSDDVADLDSQVDAVMEASTALVGIVAATLAARKSSLTLPQWRVLVIVHRQGPQGLTTIAATMGVHPSTATRACDALVRSGLLDRREDPVDRRRVVLTLTDEGTHLVGTLLGQRRARIADALRAMPAERRSRVAEAMRDFTDAVAGSPAQAVPTADWAG